MSSFPQELNTTNIPKHIAVIMDGNGRWAKQRGQNRLEGHAMGVESVRATLKTARELGVSFLTLYAFSTENWNRPKEEVDGLMDLLVQAITNEMDELNENGVRLAAIGDIDGLPEKCSNSLKKAIQDTSSNKEITLILALNYSSKWEITNAVKQIAVDVKANKIQESDINNDLFNSYLTTYNFPDPELLIRTSGEHRISNFLLWQIAYTEFYFTDIHWPDFRREHFIDAIIDYQQRERRFGKVSEQLISGK
jgi:undecaprenyl diphosphate synthase